MPWSVTLISTRSTAIRAATATRVRAGEYASALSTRFLSAETSCSRSP